MVLVGIPKSLIKSQRLFSKMNFLIVLGALLASTSAIIIDGECEDVAVVQNFDVSKYTGLWHEIYRYVNDFEPNGNCVTARYSLNEGGNVTVLNSMVIGGQGFSIQGTADLAPDANGGAKLLVNFPSVGPSSSNYWVLSTNYDSHTLVYSCANLANNKRRISSWILSREKTLSPESLETINPIINSVTGLSWETYRETDQSDEACKINRH